MKKLKVFNIEYIKKLIYLGFLDEDKAAKCKDKKIKNRNLADYIQINEKANDKNYHE